MNEDPRNDSTVTKLLQEILAKQQANQAMAAEICTRVGSPVPPEPGSIEIDSPKTISLLQLAEDVLGATGRAAYALDRVLARLCVPAMFYSMLMEWIMGRAGGTGTMREDRAAGAWCILRTAGPRTLPLAASLATTGLDVWTPVRMERRAGRGKQRKVEVERTLSITPTFVFARAEHVAELMRIRALPVSPHPAFSIFHYRDRIPLVADASLAPLHAEEDRHRLAHLKKTRRKVDAGSAVRLAEGPFAGMTGIVEGSSGKEALVNFGGGFVVSIASYLLGTDVVQAAPQPITGVAA